jgi:AcrR family transcriptional regulator
LTRAPLPGTAEFRYETVAFLEPDTYVANRGTRGIAVGDAANVPTDVIDLARRPGRPRSVEADERIIDAAIEELGEIGYARFTIDRVAKRAGVARTTLYRRWSTKLELVIEVIDVLSSRVEIDETGDCATDLELVMQAAVDQLVLRPGGRALVGVVVAAVFNPDVAVAYRGHHAHHRDAVRRILERGIASGQLRADLDVEIVLDQLGGLIPYRMIVSGEPVPVDLAARAVRSVLRGALA